VKKKKEQYVPNDDDITTTGILGILVGSIIVGSLVGGLRKGVLHRRLSGPCPHSEMKDEGKLSSIVSDGAVLAVSEYRARAELSGPRPHSDATGLRRGQVDHVLTQRRQMLGERGEWEGEGGRDNGGGGENASANMTQL
jgi:hypothetical protein